mmetsp:Transcript_14252/g.43055  ORF Transcript_14252/g.43055 Transcript_14252/m.43055 type:complete len:268 (+) Transcript_14252:820-1623(+)
MPILCGHVSTSRSCGMYRGFTLSMPSVRGSSSMRADGGLLGAALEPSPSSSAPDRPSPAAAELPIPSPLPAIPPPSPAAPRMPSPPPSSFAESSPAPAAFAASGAGVASGSDALVSAAADWAVGKNLLSSEGRYRVGAPPPGSAMTCSATPNGCARCMAACNAWHNTHGPSHSPGCTPATPGAAQRLCSEKGAEGSGVSCSKCSSCATSAADLSASAAVPPSTLRQLRPNLCRIKPSASSIWPLRSVQPHPTSEVKEDSPIGGKSLR